MTLRPILLAIALATALAACDRAPSAPAANGTAPGNAAEDVDARAAQLRQLYADYWEGLLELDPLTATFTGDMRYNAELADTGSAEHREKVRRFFEEWLGKAEAIGSAGLAGQDLLSYEIFVNDGRKALEGFKYPSWQLPVDQMRSTATMAVQLGSGTGAQPFKTVADYDNWLKRAARFPVVIDTEIANMREGMAAGVVQPRVLMEKVVPQLDALVVDDPEKSLFWGPIERMPADVAQADRERLEQAFRTLVTDQLNPAYRKLRDFIANEYLPKTRDSVGLDKLPGGGDWYAFNARQSTTTDLSPAAIHQIGLDEVARIHGEIRKVMAEVGFEGSLQDFFSFMQEDPRFSFESEEALLAHYRALEDRINARIPEQFTLLPKAPFEIRPIEAFRAKSAAGGEYMVPSEDGSRAGIFYVNTYDLPTRKTWDAEDLYLHEAIPGHHFQLALQIELTDLPTFRRWGGATAFIEGWGLYAESLGRDLGVYTDPYSYFGYLQNELWRAIRLVTDTGLHSKGWTRDQVIAYMRENSAESETQATAEAERYVAWPGQALAYKIGELRIQTLRKRAEDALGERFDVRAFHAEVLKDGSVPLDVLEQKIDRWIASQLPQA